MGPLAKMTCSNTMQSTLYLAFWGVVTWNGISNVEMFITCTMYVTKNNICKCVELMFKKCQF